MITGPKNGGRSLEDRDYIEYVNGEFGGDTTIHLQVLDDRAFGATSDTGSTRGVSAEMMMLCCTLTGLMTIGLPARFLNSFDDKDRIGLVPSSWANVDLLHCPTYNEMLHTYRLVVLTGGEHNSDCIFASRQMDRGELLGTVRRAAAQAKIETSCLGLIEGTRYDELYERTI